MKNLLLKSPSAVGALCPQHCLTFNIGDLKFCELAKLWLFKLIMTKYNFKKNLMSFQ